MLNLEFRISFHGLDGTRISQEVPKLYLLISHHTRTCIRKWNYQMLLDTIRSRCHTLVQKPTRSVSRRKHLYWSPRTDWLHLLSRCRTNYTITMLPFSRRHHSVAIRISLKLLQTIPQICWYDEERIWLLLYERTSKNQVATLYCWVSTIKLFTYGARSGIWEIVDGFAWRMPCSFDL